MRLFAIGDIHGCATALEALLAAIPLEPGDKVVALGDYINKGPDTKAVMDDLIQLWEDGRLIPLLGNHELKLLAARRLGEPQIMADSLVDAHTLKSYGAGDLETIPERHWRFVQEDCRRWFTTATHIFVHANLIANQPLTQQPDTALFWDKFGTPPPHISGKIMVCGHTPQRNGRPLNLGHAICLDTAACAGQWLTCLEVNSGQVWQANQRGEVRQSMIQDYD
ncbi:MAG: metallophosphoesterase [Nodosilinea sp.]